MMGLVSSCNMLAADEIVVETDNELIWTTECANAKHILNTQ